MRLIGTIDKEQDAKTLADYLLTLDIPTKLEEKPDGWRVWARREDQVATAVKETQAFLEAPSDPKYRVSGEAKRIRREEEKAEREHVKRQKRLIDRWEGPAWNRYPLTFSLIIASILVAILTSMGRDKNQVFRSLMFSTIYLDDQNRLHTRGLEDVREGEAWRIITPIFLHFGVWHLLCNMSVLRFFGAYIETLKSTRRLAVLVLISAAASNIAENLAIIDSQEVAIMGGMSGVGFALFGYVWVKSNARPREGFQIHPNTVIMSILWFFLCMSGSLGPIANVAHATGLVVGMAFGFTRF